MQDNEIRIVDIWKIFWRWRKFCFYTVFSIGIITAGISLFVPKFYKATTVILPTSTSSSSSFGISNLLGNFGMNSLMGGDDNTNRYIAILKSRILAEKVIKKFNLEKIYESKNLEIARQTYSKNLKYNIDDEGQIKIFFWNRGQESVANITNYIVECLDSINIMLSISNAKNNRLFIESRVEIIMDSLKILQDDMAEFMKTKGILSLEDQIRVGVENAAEMKAQIIMKEIELEVAEKTKKGDNPQTLQIQYELQSLKKNYQNLYFTDNIDQLIPNFIKLPDIEKNYIRLKMKIEYHYKILEFLGPQYEQAKIEETKDIPTLLVLDRAIRPEMRDKPRRTLLVISISAISGLFVLLLIFFLDFIERETTVIFSKLHR
ncbi:hypothetical protein KKA87_14205 [bacterium]|nr:hypothetical protein [bacterium]MBU1875037.1 hypothetical protein [bacterium]